MSAKSPISLLKIGIGVAALAGLGIVVSNYRQPESKEPIAVASPVVGPTFATQTGTIHLSDPNSTTIQLGILPLGAIRELEIEISGSKGGTLREVQSSCSCLQLASLPKDLPTSNFTLNARYFAVATGGVDVTVAMDQIDASGTSRIATFRMVGEVMPGDAARSAQLTELVKTPTLALGSADPAMFVSAKQAHLSVSSKQGILVDVRSVEEFAREHAVESLNIPLAELRPSMAFRDREIFLIGPAIVTDPMQKACARLKQQGMDRVSIVEGGVSAWQVAGGKVFQELDPQPAIGSLTVNDVVQRVTPLAVKFCGLGLGDEFVFRYHFPNGQLFPADAVPAEVIEQQLAAEPSATLVLIDQSGKNYGSLNQNAPAHWLGRVYYIQSSFDEYLQEVSHFSELATAPIAQQTSTVNGFARRDKMQRVTRPSSPGCGTCPK